jgi:hypothetical protein
MAHSQVASVSVQGSAPSAAGKLCWHSPLSSRLFLLSPPLRPRHGHVSGFDGSVLARLERDHQILLIFLKSILAELRLIVSHHIISYRVVRWTSIWSHGITLLKDIYRRIVRFA